VFEKLLYITAVAALLLSFYKDKDKTKKGLKKAWKSFLNILPAFAGVLALTGLALSVISPDFISRFIGSSTGLWGMLITSVIGAVTLIPGFIAFPLAASLLERGAGVAQIAVLVSTLMMVGIVTAPLEIQYFGKKETLLRNTFSFLFSFIAAAAGPLYAAFPIAAIMIKKGAKFTNILIFLGAWSTMKIPMFLFEMASLGYDFAVTRLLLSLVGILFMSWLINKLMLREEVQAIYTQHGDSA
jgi:uncharacterized membrane protein YraQ (UPF0718 family)